MRKIYVIARREYMAMVASKAFLISVAMMPVFMLGGTLIPHMLRDQMDVKEKRVVVLDQTGELLEPLQLAVEARNRQAIYDSDSEEQVAPAYRIEANPTQSVTDELRLKLSDRIRQGDIYAFVDIPADALETPSQGQTTVVTFYAENTMLSKTKRWFDRVIRNLIETRRLESAGIDPNIVGRSKAISFQGLGLFERDDTGEVKKAIDKDEMLTIFLPLGVMMFMFVVIMMSAQPMLESVLEEKTNRIAEVLLGSATPSQIMAGKLFGNVGGSMTVAIIYFVGGYGLARYNEVIDLAPLEILPWFIVFQILAVLMFSSLFMAIGATVNQLKEAQSLLLPVWILIVLPLFVWFNIVREPNGSFATWFSLIPPFIPMLMCLRLVSTSAVPMWQPILGLVLMLGTTTFCVFAAGRVFRIGMLTQGRAPKLNEILKWAITG